MAQKAYPNGLPRAQPKTFCRVSVTFQHTLDVGDMLVSCKGMDFIRESRWHREFSARP